MSKLQELKELMDKALYARDKAHVVCEKGQGSWKKAYDVWDKAWDDWDKAKDAYYAERMLTMQKRKMSKLEKLKENEEKAAKDWHSTDEWKALIATDEWKEYQSCYESKVWEKANDAYIKKWKMENENE